MLFDDETRSGRDLFVRLKEKVREVGQAVRTLREENAELKKELAAAEGISASAVSQRASRDGLDLLVVASRYLRSLP